MKIALFENFGSDFYNARLRYALFLQSKGFEVVAIVPDDGYADKIRSSGIKTIEINNDLRKRSLFNILSFAKQLINIFKKEKFDVVHLYRMQPNFIGTPIAKLCNSKSKIINHITGLGIAFTKTTWKYRLLQFVIKLLYKFNHSFFGAKLIFQNIEDKVEIGNNIAFEVIKGSAVNEDKFDPSRDLNVNIRDYLVPENEIKGGKILVFVSRLLKQKGLSYLIEAVNKVNSYNLLIAGWIDNSNPNTFSEKEIKEYSSLKGIHFLGKRNDIDKIISVSDIAVLPTYYREGTPRFLLEAMAMGKPILTTNMPGCNHLVKDGINGFLIQPKSSKQIENSLLAFKEEDLKSMGIESINLYHKEFSERVVYNKILSLYFN